MVFFIVIFMLVAALLATAATKPDIFVVRREMDITAPPEKIFPYINDLRLGRQWTPFEKDPKMRRRYSGAIMGVGAIYEWIGDARAGAGRLEIIESTPVSEVVMRLLMFRPMKADNTVIFTLEPLGTQTRVGWEMTGPQPFFAKVINTVINCDRMVGRDFETGLVRLKTLVEKS